MKITIEKINATRKNGNGETVDMKEGYKNIWLRRDAKYDQSSSAGLDNMFLGGFTKVGRLAFQIMSDKVIEDLGLQVGDNINDKLPTAVAVKVVETTEPESYSENIRLSLKPKANPSTGAILTANGKDIYHCTILVALSEYDGDSLVQHDKEL